jgi:hypothetical protein
MGICVIPFLGVIHQIDIEYITVFEPEYDAPVTADTDAPVPFPIAFQRVQAISGKVNVHGWTAVSRWAKTSAMR